MSDVFTHPAGNRVTDVREYDWNGPCLLLHRSRCQRATADDHLRSKTYQLLRICADAFGIAADKASVDMQIATFGPAQSLETFPQRSHIRLVEWVTFGTGHKHPDPPDPSTLLRPGRERQCRRAAEKHDELAASHSIT